MNIIITIFSLLFFLFPVALIIGLIKPGLILRWSKKPARLKLAGWWILTLFLYILALGGLVQVAESNQRALETIAKNRDLRSDIREEAVARMTDGKQLAHLARTIGSYILSDHEDRAIARAAVEKLTDQTLLATVAREVYTHVIPVEAFSKLADQAALSNLALHAKDKDMRVFAVEKLTDQTYLALIAEGAAGGDLSQEEGISVGSPEYIRMLAVKKLDSQHILAGVATKKNGHLYVRQAAIYRLTDQALVAGVAEKIRVSDTSAGSAERGLAEIIAGFAERHLAELRLLARINGNDSGAAVNASDMERLGDGQLLADIALSTFDKDVRAAAVKQLGDQRLLADIAGNISAHGDIRLLAAERLTDQQLLADIAKNEESPDAIGGEALRRWKSDRMDPRVVFTWWSQAEGILAIRRESAAVRAVGAKRLTNYQLLADVVKNARAADVRELMARG
jgi:hypothetical protein